VSKAKVPAESGVDDWPDRRTQGRAQIVQFGVVFSCRHLRLAVRAAAMP
jgi:hypothetical protein